MEIDLSVPAQVYGLKISYIFFSGDQYNVSPKLTQLQQHRNTYYPNLA
jgi:hypothetical protein